ncbi:MAG: beta-N-acetylhexosaminidase [Clostridia bacterium]|nr:beta-N-acetylhexosaminidase [Clostridia bacterium]
MQQNNRFGVMLDMSRNAVMKVDEIKKYAKTLKAMGYNMIQLYTEDTYEVDGEPYFGYLRGRYTQEELKEVVSYCNGLDMEVIPCIQTLAHLNQIFRWKTYYADMLDCNDILLVEEEKTYALIENMFKSIRKCFTSEYVHIGMDEAHMLGLGKYLDKHGPERRFDILLRHLQKVVDIAKKYGFKPLMWSDMFFRLEHKGEYYGKDFKVGDDVRKLVPKEVELVYWDYYHTEKEMYDGMISAHQDFDNNVWFAGGAWTWSGFASGNKKTFETMIPAMQSCKEKGVSNILMTMWGDNGKECSFYSVLPSLYAVKRAYDGETDVEKIKREFFELTGENFDDLCLCDAPNHINGKKDCMYNVAKHALYSDPFNGFLDVSFTSAEFAKEYYLDLSKELENAAKRSKYSYLFNSHAKLCKVLALKYDLGVRTRSAYQAEDKKALKGLIADYTKTEKALEAFYEAFKALWLKENKPHGFDVQDIRLGGLMQRIRSCRARLKDYLAGKVDKIDELEEELLPYQNLEPDGTLCMNIWQQNATVNIL